MNISDQIIQLARENNGVITTSDLSEKGILRGNLKKLVDTGKLEKTARGVYILPEIWEDEFVNLQARFKKGIFSNETALFLWDLTDRTPNRYDMTFPDNYNVTNAKNEGISCSRVKREWYKEGEVQKKSPGGNKVIAYNMERTLCDILRKRSGIDTGVITESFKRYTARKDKNIPLLSEYAKIFRVEEKVRRYLEVLI
ncbi:MAG: type IV toxin-antitoxin system AbiEi family antitoxin domain-containing protein [Lachnospiraceae bacterium]|nr:type IV toxin-antitoxin system AbiEi family antitoxin domain-containing protein [Lachnospiraceae bacterium]